ncbi:SpoIID/LytB domain-containing protein [Candidatus Gracilibacteria bacterium]|nr:SpoIID/LytB domain-containing protein [Candidatus Gracilibacteria bacterium]NJM90141.1 SpoIID/LytB domain-containing protein [Hydrococcus sp. RU_2_2]NJP19347.1 SpoIID/LytB domain-containing protein [Hydrococcus sp. CRU_1_1]
MTKIFNRLGNWTIPIISVASFVPLFLAYGLPSSSPPKTEREDTSVPSLSQVSPDSLAQKQSLVNKQLTDPSPKTPQPSTSQPQNLVSSQQLPEKSSEAAKTAPPKPQPKQQTLATTKKAPPSPVAPKLEMKVALVRDGENAVVGSSTPASIVDRNGKILKTIAANRALTVYPNGSSLTLDNTQLPYAVWLKPNAGGFVSVGDRWYRGKLLLVSQGNTLHAVNYVDLEEYLYSVVGSEMHVNESIEALKAQAIAARSYALVHAIRPASEWYHLGATQRWQAYKGIGTEYSTTHQAVNETAGQILSYKGGIVESLYAATDEIVSRVHRGVGMSQTGAYELASQGYNYQQILNRYYPGVGLARLVAQ